MRSATPQLLFTATVALLQAQSVRLHVVEASGAAARWERGTGSPYPATWRNGENDDDGVEDRFDYNEEEDPILFGGLSDDEYEERILNSLVAVDDEDDDHLHDDEEDTEDRPLRKQPSMTTESSQSRGHHHEYESKEDHQERVGQTLGSLDGRRRSIVGANRTVDRQRHWEYVPLPPSFQLAPPSKPKSSTESEPTSPLLPAGTSRKSYRNAVPSSLRKTTASSLAHGNLERQANINSNSGTTLSRNMQTPATPQRRKQQQQQQQQHAALVAITTPWVRRCLSACHRDVLLPVPKDYCADAFNLVNLASVIEHIGQAALQRQNGKSTFPSNPATKATRPFPIYRRALQLLTQDVPLPTDGTKSIPQHVEVAATALYLLLHQRYIVSPRGLDMVRRRFLLTSPATAVPTFQYHNKHVDPIFGRCPIPTCQGMPLLPIGDSDNFWLASEPIDTNAQKIDEIEATLVIPIVRRAKRYCASCRQLFYHWDSKVDGCAWGESFCHLFLMVHGAEVFGTMWSKERPDPDPVPRIHDARIFGFPLYP